MIKNMQIRPFSFSSKTGHRILSYIQHYNHDKYWKRRFKVTDPDDNTPLFLKLYYLYYIKKTDAYHNCSFGTNLHSGASFETPPHLSHGPNGIIIGYDVRIGLNCTIFQQVTIVHGIVIGNNVLIGSGTKILQGKIGNNVKIGAKAVVVKDIPDNATVVLLSMRVLQKKICNG